MASHVLPVTTLVDRVFWNRHASPRSVWWFVLAYPTLILAIYRRNRSLLTGTLLSIVVNLIVVSPPETDQAWATRVVRGEQVWLERGLLTSKSDLVFTTVAGLGNLYTLRAAIRRQRVRTFIGTALSMLLMVLFFDRMARLYEAQWAAGAERSIAGDT